MRNMIFSKCGMRCDLCLIYRPNVEKEDRRAEICNAWKKIWQGFEPDPNTTICDGCCCEKDDAILFSPGLCRNDGSGIPDCRIRGRV